MQLAGLTGAVESARELRVRLVEHTDAGPPGRRERRATEEPGRRHVQRAAVRHHVALAVFRAGLPRPTETQRLTDRDRRGAPRLSALCDDPYTWHFDSTLLRPARPRNRVAGPSSRT